MNNYQQYLRNRIIAKLEQHNSLKELEKTEPDRCLKQYYNHLAAVVWDVKCEVENCLREYEECERAATTTKVVAAIQEPEYVEYTEQIEDLLYDYQKTNRHFDN